MAEPVTLDRHTSAVLIMDFQVRIVNNVVDACSDQDGDASKVVRPMRRLGQKTPA